MPVGVLDPCEREGLKAAVHAALGALAAVCCGYNALARLHRGGGAHLTANAAVYAAIAAYEAAQVARHIARVGDDQQG